MPLDDCIEPLGPVFRLARARKLVPFTWREQQHFRFDAIRVQQCEELLALLNGGTGSRALNAARALES